MREVRANIRQLSLNAGEALSMNPGDGYTIPQLPSEPGNITSSASDIYGVMKASVKTNCHGSGVGPWHRNVVEILLAQERWRSERWRSMRNAAEIGLEIII